MNQINYQKKLDQILKGLEGGETPPSLLLQCCCAPCSSYVLEYLSRYFRITCYYYNPNIFPEEEYRHRVEELKRLVREMPAENTVTVREGRYEPEAFFEMARGMEQEPEGGERCRKCYAQRLRRTAEEAKAGGFDFFTTTLSISPLKRADWLNETGAELSEEFGVPYLFSDFKKKGGYQRSIELSAQYGLYRQNFCGCVFSKRERERQINPSSQSQPSSLP